MISGIRMSGFVFEWLPISGGMILSRRLHLFASHWGANPDGAAYGAALEYGGKTGNKVSEKNRVRR